MISNGNGREIKKIENLQKISESVMNEKKNQRQYQNTI